MSWISRNRHVLVFCAASSGLAATVWTVKHVRGNAASHVAQQPDYPDFGKSRGAFHSSLGLGKVLASWTTNFEPSVKWDSNWDRREPEQVVKPAVLDKESNDAVNELTKATPTATRHIFFIRHGQYELGSSRDEDRILTPLGREQAEFTGKRLAALGLNYDKLINSTMSRAAETSDIVSTFLPKDIPRQSCDLLREGAPIPPEPPTGHWRPNANQFFEDGARIEAAFRKYFHRADVSQEKDSHEIVVCHANVIRYFVCRALQFPPEAWLRMGLYNSSITYLIIRPSGRVSLRSLGDAGHIPPEKLTTT